MEANDPDLEWHRVIEATTMGLKFLRDGELKQITVNRTKICLARDGEQLYAVRNRCPHAGGPLYQGYLEDGDIVCPWHRFKFCLETGKNSTGEGYHLARYPVQIREDGLYIGMERRKRLFGLF